MSAWSVEGGGGGGGGGIKHEREQYLSELQLKLVYKCLSYSKDVHGSRQTVWYDAFVFSTIIPFISMRDTYFRCILSQLKESAIRPNRSCANLALSFSPGGLRFGHCYNGCNCIENGIETL